MSHKLPTDREVLRCIYRTYEDDYPGPAGPDGRHENDPYLPIDLKEVAERLGCSSELLFGRLYYHLDARHGYKQDDGARVPLFTPRVGGKRHCVHFPFLAAILAGHEQEWRKQAASFVFSTLAFAVSITSLLLNIFSKQA